MDRQQEIQRLVSSRLGELLLLVREAGERVMSVYAKEFDVVLKSDHSPLTLADCHSHEILAKGLPGIVACPVLSEEGTAIPYADRAAWDTFWSIDPLDGTKEFVKRTGDFCVSVGLVMDSAPVFGVIYVPVLEQIYFGGRGFGSYCMDPAGRALIEGSDPERILLQSRRLDPQGFPDKAEWTLLGSVSHGGEIPRALMERLEAGGPFRVASIGSAIKFCRVAEGQADFYPRYGTTMEWDTSAGQAIVQGAGGDVVSTRTGESLRYNKETLENPDFYCVGARFLRVFPDMFGDLS